MPRLDKATDTFTELLAYYVAVVSGAALIFSLAEDKSLGEAFWWAFVTAMTVGYGDTFPVTIIGKIDAVILMHVVPLFIVPFIIMRLLEKTLDQRDKFTHEEQEKLKFDIEQIKKSLNIG